MERGHDKKLILVMAATFIAVLVLAKLFGYSALIFLVLLCPIMMIIMMFSMYYDHERKNKENKH